MPGQGPEEATFLLRPPRSTTPHGEGPTRARCGWVLLAIVFLQAFIINGGEAVIRHDNKKYFHVDVSTYSQLFLVFAVFMYFVPIMVGIYVDTYAGRHRTLVFGLVLKFTGSMCGFIAILVQESFPDAVTPILRQILFCGLWLCVFLSIFGISFFAPPLVTLAIGHRGPTPRAVASSGRWFIWTMMTSIAVRRIIVIIVNEEAPDPDHLQYSQTIHHAVFLMGDIVSLGLLLLGGPGCQNVSTETGRKSLAEIVNIVKSRLLCFKPRQLQDGFDPWDTEGRLKERLMLRLDRLKLRQGVLMVTLLSCFAWISSMVYLIPQLYLKFPHDWKGPYYIQTAIRGSCQYVPALFIPLIAVAARKSHHCLWLDTTANQLKTMGVGTVFTVIGILLAGVVSTCTQAYGFEAMSVYWIIPQFVSLGFGSLLLYTGGTAFCYLESPPGLETFIATVATSLGFLTMAIEGIIGSTTDIRHAARHDEVYYILAAIVVVIGLLAFAPAAIWYLRAAKAANDFKEELDSECTPCDPEIRVVSRESLIGLLSTQSYSYTSHTPSEDHLGESLTELV